MRADSDDDALRWEGDDDPTLAPGWKAVGAPAAAEPATSEPTVGADDASARAVADDPAGADGPADAVDETAAGDGASAPAQTSSVELVVLGVLAGVYLLYTIGWLITALRTSAPGISIVSDAMYSLGLWLAVLAAPCWFALALRARTHRVRLVWLIAGAVVLVPLPFVLGAIS
ncbi:hypothetical protein BJ978_002965 [Agromyces terreus]|uniref:DNA polymerase III subunit gamma/tau n=1 Tax=Agromyces terreus TaxID=424795 RepID=A0A9X2H943_9MICO|nr:DNA polymerase III subunit gamma/tau [Agromyces terreus]MCP2372289.1 hypothetical protein [Agromyces terreus]